jgi:hypothetical protein
MTIVEIALLALPSCPGDRHGEGEDVHGGNQLLYNLLPYEVPTADFSQSLLLPQL